MPKIIEKSNKKPLRGHASPNICNIRVIGDTNTGKSCLIYRAAKGRYSDTLPSTIGADIHSFTHEVKDGRCQLITTEYTGKDFFQGKSIAKNMDAVIICFDVTDRVSLDGVKTYYDDCKSDASEDIIIILVGTKSDSEDAIYDLIAAQKAFSLEIAYLETSAMTGKGVEDLFDFIAIQYLVKKAGKQKQNTTLLRLNEEEPRFLNEKSTANQQSNDGNSFSRKRTTSHIKNEPKPDTEVTIGNRARTQSMCSK